MKLFNCVMLGVSGLGIPPIHSDILNQYSKYIDLNLINSFGWRSLVDSDPHITIIYGLNPGLGYNKLYHELKIKNRAEYLKLKSGAKITLDSPTIDLFSNDEYHVLKINFKGVNIFNELNNLMLRLSEYPNNWLYKDDYNPHLTLTYLKHDSPAADIAAKLTNKYESLLHEFSTTGFILSSDDESIPQERFS